MQLEDEIKLDFKDVLIKPKRSSLSSRAEVKLEREYVFKHSTQKYCGIPILAANMDTVGTMTMARALAEEGCGASLHKHYPLDQLRQFFQSFTGTAFYSIGMTECDVSKLDEFIQTVGHPRYLCIDVANGYSTHFVDFVKRMREKCPGESTVIMAGNVVTGDITYDLIRAGADIVKVGIGPGSTCLTRSKTGVGIPQLSAIIECADAAHHEKAHICADGGCTVPGDVGKAFAAGADFVMLGGMLAGHYECEAPVRRATGGNSDAAFTFDSPRELWEMYTFKKPQEFVMRFYGMSSDYAQEQRGGKKNYRASEGKVVEIPFKGPVEPTIKDILGGVRSTCTYVGAESLKELNKRTTFCRVSQQINNVFGSSN